MRESHDDVRHRALQGFLRFMFIAAAVVAVVVAVLSHPSCQPIPPENIRVLGWKNEGGYINVYTLCEAQGLAPGSITVEFRKDGEVIETRRLNQRWQPDKNQGIVKYYMRSVGIFDNLTPSKDVTITITATYRSN